MCIRDRYKNVKDKTFGIGDMSIISNFKVLSKSPIGTNKKVCLLYTSDAADERSSVDLGGRRIIKKKNYKKLQIQQTLIQIQKYNTTAHATQGKRTNR